MTSGSPTWADAAQAISAIFQVIAIVVAGAWTYVLFIRGRTFRRRLEPRVRAALIQSDAGLCLLVTTSVENTGSARVKLSLQQGQASSVQVFQTTAPAIWGEPLANIDWPDTPLIMTRVFVEHDAIESHEVIHDEALVPVAAAAAHLVRFAIYDTAKTKWVSTAIVPPPSSIQIRPEEVN